MLSVADIPMAGIRFTGIIGVISWKGKEYRIATYLGARVVQIHNKMVKVVQGDLGLDIQLLDTSGSPLKAPEKGNMVRMIRESVSSRAIYRFHKKGCTLFAFETDRASYEYEYHP